MKNNTKVRLHLSKSLFESITKEVLAESKKMSMSGGAYTEAVKMPKKAKKMEEVNAVADTDKMKKMEEVDAVAGMSDRQKNAAKEALFQVIATTASFKNAGVLDANEVKQLEDLCNKAMDGLNEEAGKMKKMSEMSSKEKMAKGMYKEVDAVKDTESMRKMHEMSSKEKMAKGLYKEAEMGRLKKAKAKIEKKLAEMEINVAEEDKIEENKKYNKTSLSELRKQIKNK